MIEDCKKVHLPSYVETCCLYHLIEMNEHSEDHLLQEQYSKFFFRIILKAYKTNKLLYNTYSVEITKDWMKWLLKQLCHLFVLNKLRFSKWMVNVSLDAYQKTLFKSHPDIVSIVSCVYNNIACIYERTGMDTKAWNFFHHYSKWINNNTDKLIYYNNVIRIYLKLNNSVELEKYWELFKNLLKAETDTIKNEKIFSQDNTGNIPNSSSKDFWNRCKLYSFWYYNYGFALERIEKIKDSKYAFKSGYEFTVCMLGEHNLYRNKYLLKIEKKKSSHNIAKTVISGYRSKSRNPSRSNQNNKNMINDELNRKVEIIWNKWDNFQNSISKGIQQADNANNSASEIRKKRLSAYNLTDVDNDSVILNSNNNNNNNNHDRHNHHDRNDRGHNNTENHLPRETVEDEKKKKETVVSSIPEKTNPRIGQKKNNSEMFNIGLLNEIIQEFEEEAKLKHVQTKDERTMKKDSVLQINQSTTLKESTKTIDNKTNNKQETKPIIKENDDNNNRNTTKTEPENTKELPRKVPRIKKLFEKVVGPMEKKWNSRPEEGKFQQMINSLLNDNSNDKAKEKEKDKHLVINQDGCDEISFNTGRKFENDIELNDEQIVSNRQDNNNKGSQQVVHYPTFSEKDDLIKAPSLPYEHNTENTNSYLEINKLNSTIIAKAIGLKLLINWDESSSDYNPVTYYQKVNSLEKKEMKYKKKAKNNSTFAIKWDELFTSVDDDSLSFNRFINDTELTILLNITSNSFILHLMKQDQKIYELTLDCSKIAQTLSKMNLTLGMNPMIPLSSVNTINKFAKVFVQFISIIKHSKNKLKFGISPNPIGIFVDKRIEFKLFKHTFVIDIIITDKSTIKVMLTNIATLKAFVINMYSYRNNFDNSLSLQQDISNNINVLTMKIQESIKHRFTPDSFDLIFSEGIMVTIFVNVNNSAIELQTASIYWTEVDAKKSTCIITQYLNKQTNPITLNFTADKISNIFGISLQDFDLLNTEEKGILLNMITKSSVEEQAFTLPNEEVLFTFKNDKIKYYSELQLVKIRSLVFYKWIITNKSEEFTCSKVFLNTGDRWWSKQSGLDLLINQNKLAKIIDNYSNNIYDEKCLCWFKNIDSNFDSWS